MLIRITIMRDDAPARRPARYRRISRRSAMACLSLTTALVAAGGVALAAAPAVSRPGSLGAEGGRRSAASARRYAASTASGRIATAGVAAGAGAAGLAGLGGSRRAATGLSWAGIWHAGTSYTAGDVVFYQGSSYIASGPSRGRVPSLSGRAWAVFAAAGARGAPGPEGLTGPAGSAASTDYAEFYGTPAGPEFVGPGDDVPFDQDGPSNGTGITRYVCFPTNVFTLALPGIYEVRFQVSTGSLGQLGLLLDPGNLLADTVVGRNAQAQIVGDALIQTTLPDTRLSVENSSGSPGNIIAIDGVQSNSSQLLSNSIIIELLSSSEGPIARVHGTTRVHGTRSEPRLNGTGAGPRRRNRQRC